MLVNKAKGQQSLVAKPELLAFASIARVAQMEERSPTKLRTLVRSQPRVQRSALLAALTACSLTSGFRQRQGFYAHCHFGSCAGKRQGRNDVSVMPYRDGKSWFLRTEQGPALQVTAVREAVRGTAGKAAGFQATEREGPTDSPLPSGSQ